MRISDWSSDVCSSDLLLATPEYNNSIPGVFKNAIDWASRPPADIPRVFAAKPVAVIGASPGGFGTILAQDAWLSVLRTLGAQLWSGSRLMVSGAGKAFDADGNLVDEAVKERSEEQPSELQSIMRISYAGFCLKKTRIL